MPRRGKLRCLKTKFEANKFTQGNVFIIVIFKLFLGLKICVGWDVETLLTSPVLRLYTEQDLANSVS